MNVESNRPLISIIIPTFNAASFIGDCISSIVCQQLKNIEVIVVDGNSSDGTIDIVKAFALPFLQYVSSADYGVYDAFNKGTRMAKGRWLHFLGADDRLLPGFAEIALQLKDDNTIYYGNSEADFGDSATSFELLTGPFSNYRLAKYCMNHQSILYPAKVFLKYRYDLRYKILADYDLNIKLWGDNSFKKIFLELTIVKYKMTGMSASLNDDLFKKNKPVLIRKSMGWLMYFRFLIKKFKKRKNDNFY